MWGWHPLEGFRMLVNPWGSILDWREGKEGMQSIPQRGEGLIQLLNRQGSQGKGLHPAPGGAARHSQREPMSHFPWSPAWHAEHHCHLCPHCQVRKDRSCLITAHRQTQGDILGYQPSECQTPLSFTSPT